MHSDLAIETMIRLHNNKTYNNGSNETVDMPQTREESIEFIKIRTGQRQLKEHLTRNSKDNEDSIDWHSFFNGWTPRPNYIVGPVDPDVPLRGGGC